MEDSEKVEQLKKALREAYDTGRTDGIEIMGQSLRAVLESGKIPPEQYVGFAIAVELVEGTKKGLGLE